MANSKRIALYLRSATGNPLDLKRQLKTLEEELHRRGLDPEAHLIKVYKDTHQSGLKPGLEFERMRRDVKRGDIDIVIVSRLNRVSRSLSGLLAFNDFVKTNPIRFLSSEENIDSGLWHFKRQATAGGAL